MVADLTLTPSIVRQPVDDELVATAAVENKWRSRNAYYYKQLHRLFKLHIPPGSRVLEIGCGRGELLAELQPSVGVGVETNPKLVEIGRRDHPQLNILYGNPEDVTIDGKFDYVVVCNAIGKMHDVQTVFERVRASCHANTRFILAYFNALWEPVLGLASKLHLRRHDPALNWLSADDIVNLLSLTDFEVVRRSSELLIPKNIPLVSPVANRCLTRIWPFNKLALVTFFVARPLGLHNPAERASCSIVVPTHNERGNIAEVIRRTPTLGCSTEIIFVDGDSDDGTPDEIQQHIAADPTRNIRLIHQGARAGKGDAVRKGFAAATGDVLMILDADLTVAPEDLRKFYDAIVSGRGEMINGTRLVYPLEDQAMRPLNKLANKTFSLLFSWLLGQRFRDTLCGTKALRRLHYELIAANRSYFGGHDPFGDFDLIFGAAKANQRILEIPVRYAARTYGDTSIRRFRDGLRLLRMSWVALCKLKMQ